ncbi:hypothetical protein, partial [Rhodospirillum sp. A1_3_36]|uniref:hypothetical protein n=1 Tax=Rhodospirillum sp. A1_3_36 TaxID=3391666 RepID=UPI0039A6A21F
MMNYARMNKDGLVVEVIELGDGVDVSTRYPADLGFMPCPATVRQGWQFDGDTWSPSPAPDPAVMRGAASAAIDPEKSRDHRPTLENMNDNSELGYHGGSVKIYRVFFGNAFFRS